MHTGLSSQVKGFSCTKRKMVESPDRSGLVRSGRSPGRTIRRQTEPVRRSRRTAILNRLSAGHRIRPVGRRTPGEQSGPAGLTAGASGPEAGAAELIAGLLLGQPPTARFLPTYKYPFFQLG
jgi:hypothetical protein